MHRRVESVEPRARSEDSRSWSLRAPFIVGSLVYVALRIWAFGHEFGVAPPIFPDSYVYEQSSRIPFFSTAFWTSWDPWGLPLFYKLLPGALTTSGPVAQLLVSVVAW